MDKLTALRHYWQAYQPTQLRTYRAARQWMEAGITADVATRWASAGFLPDEALPMIGAGIAVEQATEMDPTTDAERVEYLADRMRMMELDG